MCFDRTSAANKVMQTDEILKAGFELTANAIKRIILEGSPDWTMVTLN